MRGTLRWAVRLLVVETLALVGLVALLAYGDIAGGPQNIGGAFAVTVYVAMLAALVGLLARSLRRGRRWARAPAIVLNLLLLPVGYSAVVAGMAWLGVPIIGFGLATAGLLLAPATRAALPPR